MNSNKWFLLLLALLLLAVTGCTETESGITISEVWGRNSPMTAQNGAFYMELQNNGSSDDTLVSASSARCGATELHESYDQGDGVMGMRPVEGGIVIPGGETVSLAPGGLHVMCLDKDGDFVTGETFSLTLEFAQDGVKEVEVEIR